MENSVLVKSFDLNSFSNIRSTMGAKLALSLFAESTNAIQQWTTMLKRLTRLKNARKKNCVVSKSSLWTYEN